MDLESPHPSWQFDYLEIYRASPVERIALIKEGIPAMEARKAIGDLKIGREAPSGAPNLLNASVNETL